MTVAVGFQDHAVVLHIWGYGKVSFTTRSYRPMVLTQWPWMNKSHQRGNSVLQRGEVRHTKQAKKMPSPSAPRVNPRGLG